MRLLASSSSSSPISLSRNLKRISTTNDDDDYHIQPNTYKMENGELQQQQYYYDFSILYPRYDINLNYTTSTTTTTTILRSSSLYPKKVSLLSSFYDATNNAIDSICGTNNHFKQYEQQIEKKSACSSSFTSNISSSINNTNHIKNNKIKNNERKQNHCSTLYPSNNTIKNLEKSVTNFNLDNLFKRQEDEDEDEDEDEEKEYISDNKKQEINNTTCDFKNNQCNVISNSSADSSLKSYYDVMPNNGNNSIGNKKTNYYNYNSIRETKTIDTSSTKKTPMKDDNSKLFNNVNDDNCNRSNKNNNNTNNNENTRHEIEIRPGKYMTLYGAEETHEALVNNNVEITLCTNCNSTLLVIHSAMMVFCPTCRCVCPVDNNNYDRSNIDDYREETTSNNMCININLKNDRSYSNNIISESTKTMTTTNRGKISNTASTTITFDRNGIGLGILASSNPQFC